MKKIYLITLLIATLTLGACNINNKTNNNLAGTNNTLTGNTNIGTSNVNINNTGNNNNHKPQNQTQYNGNKKNNNKEGISNGNKFIGFVATWCPHCQQAVPTLEKFASNTNGQIEINVINKKAFPGVKNLKQEYNNPKSYEDYTNEKCGYIPSYVIVDQNGKVIEKKCGGSLDYEQLKDKLLKKQNDAKNLQNNTNKQMADKVVKKGDTIAVDYVGKFTDGKVFDTSIEQEAKKAGLYNAARTYKPLEFKVGEGQMIPCFDKGVEGMKIGETKTIECEPKDAYGECSKSKIIKVEKSKLADFEKNGYKLEKGVELPTQYGMLKITDVKDGFVYLDTNHPLCGKKLIFTVTVKEIK